MPSHLYEVSVFNNNHNYKVKRKDSRGMDDVISLYVYMM